MRGPPDKSRVYQLQPARPCRRPASAKGLGSAGFALGFLVFSGC